MSAMPSVKYMHVQRRVPLVKATCKRCTETFTYYRRGRHRYYCGTTCRELERKDANTFFNGQARLQRLSRVVERAGFLDAGKEA